MRKVPFKTGVVVKSRSNITAIEGCKCYYIEGSNDFLIKLNEYPHLERFNFQIIHFPEIGVCIPFEFEGNIVEEEKKLEHLEDKKLVRVYSAPTHLNSLMDCVGYIDSKNLYLPYEQNKHLVNWGWLSSIEFGIGRCFVFDITNEVKLNFMEVR